LFSQKSIRVRFLLQLSVAMATLLVFFSSILYTYISYSTDNQLEDGIIKHANYLFATYPDIEHTVSTQQEVLRQTLNIEANIVTVKTNNPAITNIVRYKDKQGHFIMEMRIPYRSHALTGAESYLIIKTDITQAKKLQAEVYRAILFLSAITMVIIIIYAFFLSNMLLNPIKTLNYKLSKMDENMLQNLDLSSLPSEFQPLGKTLNRLLMRIQNFIKYKKELFIGSAHELKTPLAVMKTKNQVTLLKKDSTKEMLKEALQQNIISIDEMNRTVSSILEFGRAEGAQLETPENIDIIAFLHQKMDGFSILAQNQKKHFSYELSPRSLMVTIQPLLLIQIVQNFVQNALKFTPEGKSVLLKSKLKKHDFIIEVIDEGCGIDESKDLFAPFVRTKESQGVGLGLFLAQSAAQALRATISLKNRPKGNGAIASLILPIETTKK